MPIPQPPWRQGGYHRRPQPNYKGALPKKKGAEVVERRPPRRKRVILIRSTPTGLRSRSSSPFPRGGPNRKFKDPLHPPPTLSLGKATDFLVRRQYVTHR